MPEQLQEERIGSCGRRSSESLPRKKALGLFTRKERWGLSWRGWLVLAVALLGIALGFQYAIHPFLAVTALAESDVLVVDGWTPTYTLKQAAAECRRGSYRQVIVLKGIYEGFDRYESGQHSADYVLELLAQYGVPRDRLQTVFCSVTRRDRTYHSAVATREWLARRGELPKALNVATVGPHARRSRLLYEKAFSGKMHIGVLALQDRTYDPARWWRSSEGIKEVISESAAYLYVRCFFYP